MRPDRSNSPINVPVEQLIPPLDNSLLIPCQMRMPGRSGSHTSLHPRHHIGILIIDVSETAKSNRFIRH